MFCFVVYSGMKAKIYIVEFQGEPQEAKTARQIAEAVRMPYSVITMRLQRGERVIETLRRPVRCYAGNDGYRAPDRNERRQIQRHQEQDDRAEQRRIAQAEDELARVARAQQAEI